MRLTLVLTGTGVIRQKHKFILIMMTKHPYFLLDGPALALPLQPFPPPAVMLLNNGILISQEPAQVELVLSHMILLLHRYYKKQK